MFNFRHFRHIFRTFRHIFLPKSAILIKLMLNLDIYFSILQHIYSRSCQGYSGGYDITLGYDTFIYRGIRRYDTPNHPSLRQGVYLFAMGVSGLPKNRTKTEHTKNIYCCKNYNIYFYPCFQPIFSTFFKKTLAHFLKVLYTRISLGGGKIIKHNYKERSKMLNTSKKQQEKIAHAMIMRAVDEGQWWD